MAEDLKIIKKYYGEAMMHFCREEFPTILEQPNALSNILLGRFSPSQFLYKDIFEQLKVREFKSYIYEIFDGGIKEIEEVDKTPAELLEEVGYTLYECKTEEDIQWFRKFYAPGEELCTFWTNRLNDCYVFFAVKNNVEKIKRENFPKPDRQDEYGTSVLSIQFTKDCNHLLSIKNRYNHTVKHPDATFSNNLDNIIEGLTYSFAIHYGMKQSYVNSFSLDGYVLARDGKHYKYNYEINNVYYCPNNIIIDNGVPQTFAKEKFIVMDYFILDLEKKKIDTFDDRRLIDSFPRTIRSIKKITILNEVKGKRVLITPIIGEDIVIVLDDRNRIVEYINNNVKLIDEGFLRFAKSITKLSLPTALEVGNFFCCNARNIVEIELPNVKEVGTNFLARNNSLKRVFLPNVMIIGDNFCFDNDSLEEVDFPNLVIVGDNFLHDNSVLRILFIPSLQRIGRYFCNKCVVFEEIDISNVADDIRKYLERNFIIPSSGGRIRKM